MIDHIRAKLRRILNRIFGRYECAECFDSVERGYYCAGCGRGYRCDCTGCGRY